MLEHGFFGLELFTAALEVGLFSLGFSQRFGLSRDCGGFCWDVWGTLNRGLLLLVVVVVVVWALSCALRMVFLCV